jgi:hypothetical protein
VEIGRLRASDDRSRFRSGDPDLDRFFRSYAGQNQFRHHVGVTYVAVEDGDVFGYLTVAPGGGARSTTSRPRCTSRLHKLKDADDQHNGSALLPHGHIRVY